MTELSPSERLLQVSFGYILTRCMTAIAELGMPDMLANGPQSIDRLAQEAGADREFLNRVILFIAHWKLEKKLNREPGT